MAAPWEKYAAPSAPSGAVEIAGPDPYKVEDQQFQRQSAAIAEQNAAIARQNGERAAVDQQIQLEKAERDRREWNATHNPDGTPRAKAGQALPQGYATDLQGKVSGVASLQRALNNFKDDFSGAGSDLENTVQSWTGLGSSGQRDWWADFKTTDNITRNSLFGASLTPGEQAAYASTSITPSMAPDEIKANLRRRLEIAQGVLVRQRQFLTANGYSQEAIDALAPATFAGPQDVEDPTTAIGKRLSPEQETEMIRILREQGGEAADQYLRSLGLALGDKDAAEKTKNNALDYSSVEESAAARAKIANRVHGEPGLSDLVNQGATLGLSDEAAGIGSAIASGLAGKNPWDAYSEGTQLERDRLALARRENGGMGIAAEIGGAFLSGNPSGALAPVASLAGRVAQGARAGAAGGAVAGYGYGEGFQNSLLGSGFGAAGGAAVGAALPVAGQVVGNRVGGLRRMVGRDPTLPRQIISEAIEADGATPGAVGRIMDDAGQRGSPMMLADTGENARALLASVGRQPGAARTVTRDAVVNRQLAQGERINEAVVRDLGPTANIRDMGDELINRARTAAAPLYEQAYAASGATVVKLDDLALRPSFRKALFKATDLASEEGIDPTTLNIQFDAAGDPILSRDMPSWQTLDYIKRGLDDVIEGYRDTTTGKLNLDGQGRAVLSTLKTLTSRMDKVNPAYAAARAAYAGPAKMREALERGVKALNKSPDDIVAIMRRMGDSEQESFRLGMRKAIVDLVNSRRDGGDKVAALLGTPKSRAALSRVFGGRAEFERFVATLRDEEAMGMTYRAVATGSPTAERLAADAVTADSGLAETAMDAALRGGKDGMWSAAVAAIQRLRDVDRFGAGQAGQRTRESIAALLTETDPAVLRDLIAAARQAAARQRVSRAAEGRRAVQYGRNAGSLTGLAAGQATHEPR